MSTLKQKNPKKMIWTKNWSGNWGLLFGSLYGDIYTKGLKELTGKYFQHNLVVFENGVSYNYLLQSELNKYCEHLVLLIKANESLTKKWSNQVIKNTNKIFLLIEKLDKQKIFSKKDYFDLQKARFAITTVNFSIKKVIDYLPADLMEKNLEIFSRVRVYTEPVYNNADRLLKKISKYFLNNKISDKQISVLTKHELEDYISNNKIISTINLDQRYDGCALFFDKKGKYKLLKGKDFKNFMMDITPDLTRQELKGMVAYRGKAVGRVKIVLDPLKVVDFKMGDILVTGMTRPEFLGLMKKSSAFITDAGGMLSHAAIVARELKRPCIVGTEIATKILKDGDLVEVDAENGLVKIIK